MAKSANNHRIDYVEFSVGDIARSRQFYGEAFGWSFKDYGPGYCEFSDGRLTGGFALAGKGNPARQCRRPSGHSLRQRSRRNPAPPRKRRRDNRQATLFIPGGPPLPLRRSGRLRTGGVVGQVAADRCRASRRPRLYTNVMTTTAPMTMRTSPPTSIGNRVLPDSEVRCRLDQRRRARSSRVRS